MNQFKSHKVVEAGKITEIVTKSPTSDGLLLLVGGEVVVLPDSYFEKHDPQVGGYYVRYQPDGYESYSPAEPFESGYTPLGEMFGDPEVEAVWGDDGGEDLEKFIRANAGAPLRLTVEARTNLIRITSVDQTLVIEGAVHGNLFQPKR